MTKPAEIEAAADKRSKLTHLYLHDKYLKAIPTDLSRHANLTVLYLHNNQIERIQNLHGLHNLTALYLQKNKIRKLENLDRLTNLRRLYVGHNCIGVVENLEALENLEELHIEKQEPDGNEPVCFDPRTVARLRKNLRVLNVSHDNLTSLDNLAAFEFVKILHAAGNKITQTKSITDAIRGWNYLEEATFSGNPVAKGHRYRETIIGNTGRLRLLDDKEVTHATRCFIKRFEAEKTNNANRRSVTRLPEEVTSLAKDYPLAVRTAVSNLVLRPAASICNAMVLSASLNEEYIAWKRFPSSLTSASKKVPPLMRKRKMSSKVKPPSSADLPSFL